VQGFIVFFIPYMISKLYEWINTSQEIENDETVDSKDETKA